MRNPSKIPLLIFFALALIVLAAVGVFAWRAYSDKRSVPGHIVRRLCGETGHQQNVNDLTEDVRRIPQLQQWSIEMLARFRNGNVKTDRGAENLPGFIPSRRLPQEERPEFIKRLWGETNLWGDQDPELLVLLSTNGQPECVAINWYDHGIAVGPPDYRLSFYPDLSIAIKPGIYAYSFNFK